MAGPRLFWGASAIAASLVAYACGGSGDGPQAGPASPAPTPQPDTGDTTAMWTPAPRDTWQWQLDGAIDVTVEADVFDVDLFDADAATVAALHQRGRHVICYVSVGSWEDWRPDASDFPPEVLGRDYEGWQGERWLDIRRIDLLGPIMRRRLDRCQSKGFDAVEPDNIDGYQNDTGFPLTAEHQRAYDRFLVEEAHARGISIGLKNDPDQAAALVGSFDWALTEDCLADGWCDELRPFVGAAKAVLMAEYTDRGIARDVMCARASELGFSAILKRRELDAWRQACP
jgi:hypothetical protein